MENKNYTEVSDLSTMNFSLETQLGKELIDCTPLNQKIPLNGESPIKQYRKFVDEITSLKLEKEVCQIAMGLDFPVVAKVFDNVYQIVYIFLTEIEKNSTGSMIANGFHFQNEFSSRCLYLKSNLQKMSSIFPYKDSVWKMMYVMVPVNLILGFYQIPSNCQTTESLLDLVENHHLEKLVQIRINPNLDQSLNKIQGLPCVGCEKFPAHSKMIAKKKKIDLQIENNLKEIEQIEKKVGKSLFQAIMEVLKVLGFVSKDGLGKLKMRIAKALCVGPEVVLFTEIVTNNLINELSYIEIPVIFCLMDFENRKKDEIKSGFEIIQELDVSEELKTKLERVNETWINIRLIEEKCGVENEEKLNFDMVECIYNWMSGFEFRRLSEYCNKLEGHILRTIYKIEKYLEKLNSFAEIFEQKDLKLTVQKSLNTIRRDILNVPSLYLTYED